MSFYETCSNQLPLQLLSHGQTPTLHLLQVCVGDPPPFSPQRSLREEQAPAVQDGGGGVQLWGEIVAGEAAERSRKRPQQQDRK